MIKLLLVFVIIIPALTVLNACNKDIGDTSELYEKSQTNQMIIERSGTTFRAGSDEQDLREQMDDAQNRLRTGGGLFGKSGLDFMSIGESKKKESVASVGMPINPYLWKGAIETIDFMPLVSADPFAGIIITDWYTNKEKTNERCKLNIFIKGQEFETENLKVNSFCQILSSAGNWIDQEINQENNFQLENAILNKAKKIRLAQN